MSVEGGSQGSMEFTSNTGLSSGRTHVKVAIPINHFGAC
jgi:hypothetical protein